MYNYSLQIYMKIAGFPKMKGFNKELTFIEQQPISLMFS